MRMKTFDPLTPLPVLMPVSRNDLAASGEAIPWRAGRGDPNVRPASSDPMQGDTR